jgi:hypothetical protein
LDAAEHIVLESDVREVPRPEAPRKVHASLHCRTRLRRRSLSLSIFDYYYLAVRTGRTGRPATEYVLDLRFIDPSLRLSRHVPWRSILVAVVLSALTVAGAFWQGSMAAPSWRHVTGPVAAALLGTTACAYLVVAYRLIERVAIHSIYGRATVLDYTGGPGTLRAARPFLRKVAAHIRLAARARRSTKAEHLRDELREHHRLMDMGVLNAETYDASKARILAQHSAARPKR